MNVAELFAVLGFAFDEKSEKEFDQKLDGFAGALGKWADDSAAFMGKAFSAFFLQDLYEIAKAGIGRVVGLLDPREIFGAVENQAGVLDELAKQARSLDITTEALQRYRFVAGQTGVDQKQFERSMVRTNKALGEARRGVKSYADIFKDLGLDANTLADLSGEERFDTVLSALSEIDDVAKRTALGSRLLGERAFSQFATLLKGGREGLAQLKAQADSLGFVVSDKDAQDAEAFNDALDRTTRAATALKNSALNPLLRPLTRVLSALQEFVTENREILSVPFRAFGAVFAAGFGLAADAVFFLNDQMDKLRPTLEAIGERVGGVNGLLRWATILTIAFGAAWAWTQRTQLLLFLGNLAVELAVVIARLVLAGEAALVFLLNSSRASLWASIQAGFARLAAILTGTTAQFVLLAAFVALVLLLLEDVWVLFSDGNSVIGEAFGIDPNSQADLEKWYDTLLLIGVALSVILFFLGGIPGVIALALVLIAYLAANWDRVTEAVGNMVTEVVDFFHMLAVLLGIWAEGVGDSIADVFWGIVDTIKAAIQALLNELGQIPAKARGILSQIPGADLLGSGAEIVASVVGGGAASTSVDQAARVFQARNNRSVNISPEITVQVDAKDRSANEAADIFKGSVFDELFRDIEAAYDGEET